MLLTVAGEKDRFACLSCFRHRSAEQMNVHAVWHSAQKDTDLPGSLLIQRKLIAFPRTQGEDLTLKSVLASRQLTDGLGVFVDTLRRLKAFRHRFPVEQFTFADNTARREHLLLLRRILVEDLQRAAQLRQISLDTSQVGSRHSHSQKEPSR